MDEIRIDLTCDESGVWSDTPKKPEKITDKIKGKLKKGKEAIKGFCERNREGLESMGILTVGTAVMSFATTAAIGLGVAAASAALGSSGLSEAGESGDGEASDVPFEEGGSDI